MGWAVVQNPGPALADRSKPGARAAPKLARRMAASDALARARTVCEAFQIRVREAADEPALPGHSELTWARSAMRVERIAGGLAALGVHHADTVALLLGDRPERHLVAAAAMHLGAPTLALGSAEGLMGTAAGVVVTEPKFVGAVLEAQRAGAPVAEVVLVEGSDPRAIPLCELEGSRPAGFLFATRWRAVQPSDRLTLGLTHDEALARLRAGAALDPSPLLGLRLSA
jgi:long-chain acyl-CoA synthetase